MNIENILKDILIECENIEYKGILADYIPPLKYANINDIALSLINDKGEQVTLGDAKVSYTIQSVSKVISLTLALLDNGIDGVYEKVGFGGTFEKFNAISHIGRENVSKPTNPMMNAGAIVTTSLIKDEEPVQKTLEFIRRITGNKEINYNKEVYLEEKRTGDRNKALAYLLKSKNILKDDPEKILDNYFKQCSIEMTTEELAKIAYFYSNGGVVLGETETLVSSNIISSVNAVMSHGGMYNNSGKYASSIGIPSKSGVSGCILGVVPKKAGIAVYSPGLDEYGNSLIGQELMKRISEKLDYSIF